MNKITFSQWRAWIKEEFNHDPQPEINPLWITYHKLTPELQAICQKPTQWLQNRESVLDEVTDDPDLNKYQYSHEVPTNMAFVSQGSEYQNEYLDAGNEGRYLREYCVQRTSPSPANHFLHLKTLTDLRSKNQWADPDWMVERSDLEYDRAYHFADALTRLDYDWPKWLKLYHGSTTAGYSKMTAISKKNRIGKKGQIVKKSYEQITESGQVSVGLKDMDSEQLQLTIDLFIEMADEADKVSVKWINHINAADIEKEYLADYMKDFDHRVIQAQILEGDEENQWDDGYVEFLPADDNLDRKNSTNPYSTNRLSNGKDALSYEFIRLIQTADRKQLTALKDGMFATVKRSDSEIIKIRRELKARYGDESEPRDRYSRKRYVSKYKQTKDGKGYWVKKDASSTGLVYRRPKFHYFTDGMKSHFWKLYKTRRDELNNQKAESIPVAQLSDDAKVALEWIESLGKGRMTAALIYAAKEGSSMDLFGMKVKFSRPLPQPEVATLWNVYASI
jgi:hypothetical protein